MSHLTDTQLKELKDKLLEEKRELEAHFAQEEDDESLLDSTGELSSYDNHPADIGTETFERSRDQAVDRNLEEELEQIGAALARMQSGEYGTCAVCGKPIPFERLQAVPYSPYCTRHADEARRGEAAPGRPVEEQVMTPPPTGAGENRQRGAGRFDDADAWNTVESYGNSDSPAMAVQRDADGYDRLSSDKVDRTGQVEEVEGFAGNDMQGKQRHVQQTKRYRDYVEREEGERLADEVEREAEAKGR